MKNSKQQGQTKKNLIGALLTKQKQMQSPSENHLYGFPPSIPKSQLDLHITSQKNPRLRRMFRLSNSRPKQGFRSKINSLSCETFQEDFEKIISKDRERSNKRKGRRKKYSETTVGFYKPERSMNNELVVKANPIISARKPIVRPKKVIMRGSTADKVDSIKRASFLIPKEDSILGRDKVHKRFQSFHNGQMLPPEAKMPSILSRKQAKSERVTRNFFLTHTNFHTRKPKNQMYSSVKESEEAQSWDLAQQIISESPFFKGPEEANSGYQSTTILTKIRKKKNELKTAYLKMKKISKNAIESPSTLKEKIRSSQSKRMNADRINSMVKSDYDHFGSELENKVRNISYLYNKSGLLRNQKKNPLELLNPEEANKKKASTLKEIRGILKNSEFPLLGEELFDLIAKMKLSHFNKKKVIEKANDDLHTRDDCKDFAKKTCSYVKNFNVHGCYERNKSVSILKWLETIKAKYKKDSSSFNNSEDYFRAMKDILAFSNKEVIEAEKMRCKETSMLMETLYMDNLDYIQSMFDYLGGFLKQVQKKHKGELNFMREIGEKKLESLQYDNNVLEENNLRLKQENSDHQAALRKMRSKLSNDYVLIRNLRSELGYFEEMLRVTRIENQKITQIIRDMNIELKDLDHDFDNAGMGMSFDKINQRLYEIERTHERYQEELHALNDVKRQRIEEEKKVMSEKQKLEFMHKMGDVLGVESSEVEFTTASVEVQTEAIPPEGEEKETQTDVPEVEETGVQTLRFECKACVEKEKILLRMDVEDRKKIRDLNKEKMHIIEEKEELEKEKNDIAKEIYSIEGQMSQIEKEKEGFFEKNKILKTNVDSLKSKLESEKNKFEEMLKDYSAQQSSDGGSTSMAGSRRTMIPRRLGSPSLTIQQPGGALTPSNFKRSSTQFRKVSDSNLLPIHNRLLTRGDSMYSVGFESAFSNDEESISIASVIPDDVSVSDLSELGLRKVRKIHKALLKKLSEMSKDDELFNFYKAKADMYMSYLKSHMKRRASRRFKSRGLGRRGIPHASAFNMRSTSSIKEGRKSKKNKKLVMMIELSTSLFKEVMQMIKNSYIPKKKKLTRDITLVKEIYKIYHYFEETEESIGEIKINFNVFVFKYLRSRNSHKKIVSKKYKYLLYSIHANMKISSIRLFAKFVGMSGSLSKSCIRVYLAMAKKAKERYNLDIYKRKKLNLNLRWKGFKDTIKFYLKKFLPELKEKHSDIKATILKNAEHCSLLEKNSKVIDFDDALNFILEEHSLHSKDPISDFFETADLNGDGSLDYTEFVRITRHVEKQFYLKHKDSGLKKIFNDFAVVEEEDGEEERVITPITFKKLCRTYNIYSKENQQRFLQAASYQGMACDIEELQALWSEMIKPKFEIELLGVKNNDIKMFFNRLDTSLLNMDEKIKQKVWLNYKILESEIERIHSDKYIQQNTFAYELKKLDELYLKGIEDEI